MSQRKRIRRKRREASKTSRQKSLTALETTVSKRALLYWILAQKRCVGRGKTHGGGRPRTPGGRGRAARWAGVPGLGLQCTPARLKGCLRKPRRRRQV